jgi:gamma-glutamyltranspeptidase / glutathione hydrolase
MNFNYTNTYSSTRIPLFARNAVSTSHPLAAQAGLRMLLLGGNAVDAAIAAAAALTWQNPLATAWAATRFAFCGTATRCTG